MTIRTRRSTIVRGVGATVVALTLLGACGGGDDGDDVAADETSSTESTTTTVDAAAEEEAAGAVITEFFRLVGEGDFAGASALLEDGATHQPKLEHCADLVAGVTVEMTSVELTDPDTATALFAILKDGEVLLAESGGGAVKADGEWLVSENTFLSLYDAAKEGCTGPPPPAE